jgi:hypothetical protein
MGDATTIWFRQRVGLEWHYIDYYEATGEGLKHYVKMLNEKPYVYGKHVLPHDIKQRELGTGTTRLKTLRELEIRNIQVQKKQTVEDRIEAARKRINYSWFDKTKCALGIEHLKSYQKKYDKKTGLFLGPLHDKASHGADSFGYSALDDRPGQLTLDRRSLTRQADNNYDEFSFGT